MRLRRHSLISTRNSHTHRTWLHSPQSETVAMTDPMTPTEERWLTPGVRGMGQPASWPTSATESPRPCCPICSPPPWAPPPRSSDSSKVPYLRRAGRSRSAGRRRHRRRPPPPPRPGRRRLHHHRRPLQPHRRRHHRLAGRHPLRRRLGRLWPARPARNAVLANIVPASVYGCRCQSEGQVPAGRTVEVGTPLLKRLGIMHR
jgi:hypothetical protein